MEDKALWLVEGGASMGADTVVLDKMPSANLPAHVILRVRNGIHIMEVICLEELAADGIYKFLFMASP
jgi:kynurenine formamidase